MKKILTIPDDLYERIAERASEFGCPNPDDFMLTVLEAEVEEDEITPEQIIADIKQALRDVENGNVMTVEELEKYLESPDDD